MATRIVPRRKARPTAPTTAQTPDFDPFHPLQRSWLELVNRLELVKEHFGDIASLPRRDHAAAFTLIRAVDELSDLYDLVDHWHATHRHVAKPVKS
jgi:hypothetical protein